MIATHICKDLYECILSESKHGTVHSIFKNSINILGDDGKFISVIGPNKPMSPNAIKVDILNSFNHIKINTREKGQFTKDFFSSKHLYIYYGSCELWDKRINFSYKKDSYENLLLKLQQMGDFILYHGYKSGIFPVLQTLEDEFNYADNILDRNIILGKSELFIKDRFLEFIKSFRDSKQDEINLKAKKIIGFGAGLTPAMDDFLSGLMIANIYINHYLESNLDNVNKINYEIIKDMDKITTFVSEEMLKSSSKGEANEDIRNLMLGLVGTSTKEEFIKLTIKVADLGHSSGTDILCGIYIGSYIILGTITRGNIDGSSQISY